LLAAAELGAALARDVAALPAGQRAVLLRDVDARAASEASQALDLSAVNQRVLLHRARGRLRATLSRLLGAD
jgi:RNA polymerase sigma-70 factor (ECF subfamily)